MKETVTEILTLKKNDTIVFDGDSITARRGGPSLDTWPLLDLFNWKSSYADEVSKLLFCLRPDLNLKFHNAAVGGSIIQGLLERMDKFVLPHKPNLVIMTIGNNDARRKMDRSEFRKAVIEYIEKVRETSGGKVLILGGFKANPGFKGDLEVYKRKQTYYNDLKKVADENGAYYYDVGTALLKKAKALYKQSDYHSVYSDGGHLNAIGNIIVAGEVLKALNVEF